MAFIFAAAVIISALALALSAYLISMSTRADDALDKALGQSRFNLYLADRMPASPQLVDYTDLLEALQIRGDFATLIEAGEQTYVSGPQVGPQVGRQLVTQELAASVAEGRLAYQTVDLAGEPAIAVGGQVRPDLTLYFFYPQGERLAELTRLRNILLIGGAVLAVLGALAGYLLARRLVAPVGAASVAAEKMSHGDLSIRLRAGNDEFGALAASFNRMAENLQTKIDDLEAGQARERRFVADVTHELRTPVAALVGEASLLKSRIETAATPCQPEVARLADLVTDDVSRLRQLVDDLLEISRLDARAADTFLEWVAMDTFINQLVAAHGWSESVQFEWQVDGPDAAIHTDKRRVERILVNLIENGLRHGSPPLTIRLAHGSGEGAAAVLKLTISDMGPGIAPNDLPHIFDRFYKADPSRSSSRGSGLGLAIARENARLLGGDLVATGGGGGASFVLTLPVSCPEAGSASTS